MVRGETLVAQTALTGALISNCLMIFGTCQLFGGIQHDRQFYPVIIACTNAQVLVVSLVSITLPTAFKSWSQGRFISRLGNRIALTKAGGESGLLSISRGAAIVLLLEFASYICFFYFRHSDIDDEPAPNLVPALIATGLLPVLAKHPAAADVLQRSDQVRSLKVLRTAAREERPDEDKPRHPVYLDVLMLAFSITVMSFTSIYVLEAVEAPSQRMNLSKSFVGLIIMPSIIASVEHITAILRSRKESIGWIIEVAFGSSIRISLFVFPLAVITGWINGVPMDMTLDGFQVTILCLTIILVNHVIHNGYGHWYVKAGNWFG